MRTLLVLPLLNVLAVVVCVASLTLPLRAEAQVSDADELPITTWSLIGVTYPLTP